MLKSNILALKGASCFRYVGGKIITETKLLLLLTPKVAYPFCKKDKAYGYCLILYACSLPPYLVIQTIFINKIYSVILKYFPAFYTLAQN